MPTCLVYSKIVNRALTLKAISSAQKKNKAKPIKPSTDFHV